MVILEITKAEYKEKIFSPLAAAFRVPIIFNGESPEYRVRSGQTSGAYYQSSGTVVVRHSSCPTTCYTVLAYQLGQATAQNTQQAPPEPRLKGGYRNFIEAQAEFVSYWACRNAGATLPSIKKRSDDLYAKHQRIYRRFYQEPLYFRSAELMDVAEEIAFTAKPGLVELLTGYKCGDCEWSRNPEGPYKPCHLLARPLKGQSASVIWEQKQRRRSQDGGEEASLPKDDEGVGGSGCSRTPG